MQRGAGAVCFAKREIDIANESLKLGAHANPSEPKLICVPYSAVKFSRLLLGDPKNLRRTNETQALRMWLSFFLRSNIWMLRYGLLDWNPNRVNVRFGTRF